ncbi:hypothetical protein O6H91_11G009600 [Diphasiastrum complanatum]|uniref:Uncharacterized protein n=1 Tax=Diphasiastrum complanatum TaxID=34168 RepID=A0ACC2C6B2_DIPCM|nr:hypothetical protein O6H91_11G009600 [Diphasiastrum complanatum]
MLNNASWFPRGGSNLETKETCSIMKKAKEKRSKTVRDCSKWSSETIKDLLACVLYDPSVRARRSAMQFLIHLAEFSKVDGLEEEFLYTAFLKIRDKDKKVRLQALDILTKISVTRLALYFRDSDWSLLFEQAFHCVQIQHGSGGHDRFTQLVQSLLAEYLLSDEIPGSPSMKLKAIEFAESKNFDLYAVAMEKQIDAIFQKELKYIDEVLDMEIDMNL